MFYRHRSGCYYPECCRKRRLKCLCFICSLLHEQTNRQPANETLTCLTASVPLLFSTPCLRMFLPVPVLSTPRRLFIVTGSKAAFDQAMIIRRLSVTNCEYRRYIPCASNGQIQQLNTTLIFFMTPTRILASNQVATTSKTSS